MARKVSTETRQDLLQAVRERYRGSLKEEKLRILDEFVAVTGYHRKHVIRLFNAAPVASGLGRRARLPVYDEAVREALILLWEYEFFDPPARLFYMNATRSGVPFDVFHRYVDNGATFRVRVAGLYPMVDKHGPGITNDETVTLMNDVLVMAPAAVLDLPFIFETTGERTLRATFRNAGFARDCCADVRRDRRSGRLRVPRPVARP